MKQDFLSGPGSHFQVLVPASQDYMTDTYHLSSDGKHIIAAYAQPSRNLVIADDVPGITAPRSQP